VGAEQEEAEAKKWMPAGVWRRTNKLGKRAEAAEQEIELEGLLAPFSVCFVGCLV
jgi:hypothetical protein